MNYSAEEIGKRIKEQRLKTGMLQETLGIMLGKKSGAKQISKYESGCLPPLEVLLKLCEIFNCELGYFLGDNEYSSGTKLNTTIENIVGLNNDSIDALIHITGSDKECINWGYHSHDYRRILNALISAPLFTDLISTLFEYDQALSASTKLWTDLEAKYGKELVDDVYSFAVDYDYDDTPQMDSVYYQVLHDIQKIESDSYGNQFQIKFLRFQVREIFEKLLNSLYPQD